MSRHHDVVVTLAQVFCSLSLVVMMSRHRFSCRDITLRFYRLHWLFFMSRPQFSCRDISSFNCCSFFSCLCFDPCRDLHQIPFNLPDVATSELDCVDLQTASMTQPVAFISALSIDCIFLSTYCCIFLLSFFLPANDKLVSFFIFLYINYSFLDENQTEKWTKNR